MVDTLYIPDALSSASAIRAISGIFLTLCTIFVAARFYARHAQKARLEADDWLMVPAWLFLVALAVCMIESTYMGSLGYTPAEQAALKLTPDAHDAARIQITIDIFFAICLGLVKLSALQFYKRVFCVHGQQSGFRTTLTVAMVVVVLWIVAFSVLPLAQCGNHLEGYWIRPVFNQYCATSGHAYLVAASASDCFLELVVILLPVRKIWSLHTSARRKIAITLVFLTAVLSLAAALARLGIIAKMFTASVTSAAVAAQANSAMYNIWVLECGASILAINMPSLWYLRSRKMPEKMLASFRSMITLRSRRSQASSAGSSMANARSDDPASMELGSTRKGVFGESGTSGSGSKVHVYISSNRVPSASRSNLVAEPRTVTTNDNIKVTKEISQNVEHL